MTAVGEAEGAVEGWTVVGLAVVICKASFCPDEQCEATEHPKYCVSYDPSAISTITGLTEPIKVALLKSQASNAVESGNLYTL